MQWLKSLITFKVGSRTMIMTAVAALLKVVLTYIASHGIVLDPLILDTLMYTYTAALAGTAVFARKAIQNIGK